MDKRFIASPTEVVLNTWIDSAVTVGVKAKTNVIYIEKLAIVEDFGSGNHAVTSATNISQSMTLLNSKSFY